MSVKKGGLGSKGLGIEALINTKVNDLHEIGQENEKRQKQNGGVIEIDINEIEPNRNQPRKNFDEQALEELAESLKNYGVIQPVILKKVKDYYEIIAGERRWRAAKIAGLKKLPAVIKDCDSEQAFEMALIENLQREDLNPMEEAESYRRLHQEFSLNQEQIAQKVGKSRSAITNAMRLLNLDARVQNFVVENKITSGHARALLAIEDIELQFELAEKIIEDGLSVRAIEHLVKEEQERKKKTEEDKKEIKEDTEVNQARELAYKNIENELKSIFATKVKIQRKKNKGKIEIEYYSDDEFDRLVGLLKDIEK